MEKNFPTRFEQLAEGMDRLGQEIPGVMKGFGELHHAGGVDAALSHKTKELIALSIAVVVRCDGCIAYHVHDALEAGATHQEVVEAIGVAIVMGGGPSVVYGTEALEALEQFEAELIPA